MRRKILLLIIIFSGIFVRQAFSQEIALKTNLLYDATMTVNLGVEAELSPKWSLDLSGNFNGWTLGHGRRWKHWLIQPEARYWLCEPFGGHFFGVHALGGQYNVGHLGFARASPPSKTTVIKGGSADSGWHMVTAGFSHAIGISRRR